MIKKHVFFVLIGLVFLTACAELQPEPETPVPSPTPAIVTEPRLLISEVQVGEEGQPQQAFVELYNPSPEEPINLEDWSVWYLPGGEERETLLYRWEREMLIAPLGHVLLAQVEGEQPVLPDAWFDETLDMEKGKLVVRMEDDSRSDSLRWGEGGLTFQTGSSLERKPGGENGNGLDTGENRQDFFRNDQPAPQNTGSPQTPLPEKRLTVDLQAPDQIRPGSTYGYSLTVTNQTGGVLQNVQASFTLPDEIAVLSASDGFEITGNRAVWQRDQMLAAESVSAQITVEAPLTYLDVWVQDLLVEAENWAIPGVGGPVLTRIAGGTIPIETARTFQDQVVVVEGTATMYTGGFESENARAVFFLDDGSAGVKVLVPEDGKEVAVGIGDAVRVEGTAGLVEGTLALRPERTGQIQVLEKAEEDSAVAPKEIEISELAERNDRWIGRLLHVTGRVERVTEFEKRYEVELQGEETGNLTLSLDKATGIQVDHWETGDRYEVTGILDLREGQVVLRPRQDADLEKVYPPILRLELEAPDTVQFDEAFWATLTVTNHTPDRMTGLDVSIALPENMWLDIVEGEGGLTPKGRIRWRFHELKGGESKELRFQMRAAQGSGYLILKDARAVSRQWNEPATSGPHYLFIGDTIPIWALQGSGSRSPYVGEDVTTRGVVTGVFPDLGGFWIQEVQTDEDFRTSAGLFAAWADLGGTVKEGDLVQISGSIQEAYSETQIKVPSGDDIQIIAQDQPLPLAVELDPPAEEGSAQAYYEAREGMLVKVDRPARVVAPTSELGSYVLVLEKEQIARLWSGEEAGYAIWVDDGTLQTHQDRSDLDDVVRVGDRVSGLRGVLAYSRDQYRVVTLKPPVISSEPRETDAVPEASPDEFGLATWNLGGLFDPEDPHPGEGGSPAPEAYQTRLTKMARTILTAGTPAVIALQEVENQRVLEDLAAHDLLEEYAYQAFLKEEAGGEGLAVGYLIRTEEGEVLSLDRHTAPEGFPNPSLLLLEVAITRGEQEQTLFVINTHFTASQVGAANNPVQQALADWVVKLVEGIQDEQPGAQVVVAGSLNAGLGSTPVEMLKQAGLAHVFEVLPEEERYTAIEEGISWALDHMLVSPDMNERLSRVHVLHVNADFPVPPAGDVSPRRASDHDPVIAFFTFPD